MNEQIKKDQRGKSVGDNSSPTERLKTLKSAFKIIKKFKMNKLILILITTISLTGCELFHVQTQEEALKEAQDQAEYNRQKLASCQELGTDHAISMYGYLYCYKHQK
jgi:hypothetical protein